MFTFRVGHQVGMICQFIQFGVDHDLLVALGKAHALCIYVRPAYRDLPVFSRFHFLSFSIKEEGKRWMRTPSESVCTLALNFASLSVLLALVVNWMFEISFLALSTSRVLGKVKAIAQPHITYRDGCIQAV